MLQKARSVSFSVVTKSLCFPKIWQGTNVHTAISSPRHWFSLKGKQQHAEAGRAAIPSVTPWHWDKSKKQRKPEQAGPPSQPQHTHPHAFPLPFPRCSSHSRAFSLRPLTCFPSQFLSSCVTAAMWLLFLKEDDKKTKGLLQELTHESKSFAGMTMKALFPGSHTVVCFLY